jgi:hypothetical protein
MNVNSTEYHVTVTEIHFSQLALTVDSEARAVVVLLNHPVLRELNRQTELLVKRCFYAV